MPMVDQYWQYSGVTQKLSFPSLSDPSAWTSIDTKWVMAKGRGLFFAGVAIRLAIGLLPLPLLTGCSQEIPEVIFIIAGQSNAVGKRNPEKGKSLDHFGKLLPEDVPIWFHAGKIRRPQNSERWKDLKEMLAQPVYRMGPEVGIASTLVTRMRRKTGLLKVAFDGAALGAVPGPDWHPASNGELFSRLTDTVRSALGSRGRACVAGVFWIQGETDAASGGSDVAPDQPATAAAYRDNLLLLVTRLRQDLGQPSLPVIIASLAAPLEDRVGRRFGYRTTIVEAQAAVADSDQDVRTVATDGIELAADGLHYSPVGQLNLGQRLGEAMLELLEMQKRLASPCR
jgi:hypothetical protein